MSKLTAWSYSRISLWEQCPLKFKLKHIDKLPEEQSPAASRGDTIHKEAAAFISGATTGFPPSLAKFDAQMWELHDLPRDSVVVEQQWGFTKSWRPTGWFGANTWFRNILDVGVVYPDGHSDVVDHKTGKEYPDHADQRELNALSLMCRFPDVSHVTSRMWYLDAGHETIAEFEQHQKGELQEKWEKRVAPMFADTVFAPRPNDKCKWCAYARSKNGPCKFG